MGYYVTLTGAMFTIPQAKWDEAFDALVELNTHDELKTGGRWSKDGQTAKWFAWMDEDYPARAREAMAKGRVPHPLINVFEQLLREEMGGGSCITVDDAGMHIEGYYESKMGNEEHFFAAVAPFVEKGSYLEWRGEDDDIWRQEFDGKTMKTRSGRLVVAYDDERGES